MEIEKINAKLDTFTGMVMKDAAHKAGILLNQARSEEQRQMEEKEITFLKDAYRKIHDAIQRIDRENNETYSAKLFEARQLLFKKRQELINSIFCKVAEKLEQFRKEQEYTNKLKVFIQKGIEQVGQGDIHVYVDSQDTTGAWAVKNDLKKTFSIDVSDQPLGGGCIVMNKSTGVLVDYSFHNRLEEQRNTFLEYSGLSIDIESGSK